MSLQNLFVAKLPRNITDDDLGQIFSQYKPKSAKIMLDASTGKSKGFGFVLFDTEEAGAKAYKALNRTSTQSCGHTFTLVIYPSNHDGKVANEESNTLYIRNIPMSVPKENVEKFLKQFGNLVFFALREDHYGSPVWVVYAEYETKEDAARALHKLHNNNSFFYGSAPILAKYEDSEEAKKNRRKRREGTNAAGVPNSGCVFPPPRDSATANGSSKGGSGASSTTPGRRGVSGARSSASPPAFSGGATDAMHRAFPGVASQNLQGQGSYGGNVSRNGTMFMNMNAGSLGGPSGSPGSFMMPQQAGSMPFMNGSGLPTHGGMAASLGNNGSMPSNNNNSNTVFGSFPMSATPNMAGFNHFFPGAYPPGMSASPHAMSLPQQLLQPTSGYCYMLGDSGHNIFIPAANLSHSSVDASAAAAFGGPGHNGFGCLPGFVPQSAPAGPVAMHQPQQSGWPLTGMEHGASLLTPQPQTNGVVMTDGGQQFVLSQDTNLDKNVADNHHMGDGDFNGTSDSINSVGGSKFSFLNPTNALLDGTTESNADILTSFPVLGNPE